MALCPLLFLIKAYRWLSLATQFSPARRRSLFTLATAMLVFAAKTYNIPQIIAPAKVPLTSLVVSFYMPTKIYVTLSY